jgi:hypothetical protein
MESLRISQKLKCMQQAQKEAALARVRAVTGTGACATCEGVVRVPSQFVPLESDLLESRAIACGPGFVGSGPLPESVRIQSVIQCAKDNAVNYPSPYTDPRCAPTPPNRANSPKPSTRCILFNRPNMPSPGNY